MIGNEWEIKGRATACSSTGRPFEEGEYFYTLLFREKEGFRREDLCEEAWKARNENIQPFSFWRTRFEAPPPPPPEPMEKETAEGLLRRFMGEGDEAHSHVRFVLAVMLERKRILKQIEAREEDGRRLLIYEHAKSGDVFVIPDPGLRLDQVASVQSEIAALLA
jgi:hypothetical protein